MDLRIQKGRDSAPIKPLIGHTVSILGYGNQGHAHALNLRDSGVDIIVGNREGSENHQRAINDGFEVIPLSEAASRGDLIIIALPDELQPELYASSIEPNLRDGAIIGFLHGFCIRYQQIRPAKNIGVIMVAPKGPGATVRERYTQGLGLPCLFAVHQDSPAGDAEAIGLAWAGALGCARAGIISTTFAAETETDLFGEQVVLCGGMTSLILAAFETLVEAGYPPELAYLECCHEAKQVADLVYEGGLASMMKSISNTAEFGAYQAGPILVDEVVRKRMKKLLQDIQDGSFARTFLDDCQQGFPWFERQREILASHPIESAGEIIRGLMPKGDSSKTEAPPTDEG